MVYGGNRHIGVQTYVSGVLPVNMSFHINLNKKYFSDKESEFEVFSWLYENIGERWSEWNGIYRVSYFSGGRIYFKNEEDAMAFKIMFSEFCL